MIHSRTLLQLQTATKLSITTDMALRQGASALDILNTGPPGRKRSTLQASLPAERLKELRLLAEYHLLCFVQTPFEFVFSGDRATEGRRRAAAVK